MPVNSACSAALLLLIGCAGGAQGQDACPDSTRDWPVEVHEAGLFRVKVPPGWKAKKTGPPHLGLTVVSPAGSLEIFIRLIPPSVAATQGMAFCTECKPFEAGGRQGWILREPERQLADLPHPAFPEGGRLTFELASAEAASQRAFACILETLEFLSPAE